MPAIILLLLLLSACKTSDSGSDLQHNWGEIFRTNYPTFLWQATSRAEFIEQNPASGELYADNDPVQLWWQTWVDRVDEQLRNAFGARPDIPRPQILLVKNASAKAYVSGISVCPEGLSVNIAASQSSRQAKALSIGPERNWFYIKGNSDQCIAKKMAPEDLQSIVDWILPNYKPCISLNAGFESVYQVELNCLAETPRQTFAGYRSIETVHYSSASNIIVIHDKFLEYPKEEVMSIVAHELAHYYRAHVFEGRDEFEFFYRLDAERNLNQKPQPLPLDDVASILGKKVLKDSVKVVKSYPVPGQTLHSLIFSLVDVYHWWFTSQCGQGEACQRSCQDLAEHFQQSRAKISLGGFPRSSALPDSEAAKAFYSAYESKAMSCFKELSFETCGDSCESLRRGFTEKMAVFGLPELEKNLQLESFPSFAAAVNAISLNLPRWIDEQNKAAIATISQANQLQLGYYTAEQEADEIALEILARLSIDPQFAVKAFLSLLKTKDQRIQASQKIPGDLNYEECLLAYQNGFRDFVPIAIYSDPHHSACFRAYNLYREVKAHQHDRQ